MTEPWHLILKLEFEVKTRTEGNNYEGNKARLEIIVRGKTEEIKLLLQKSFMIYDLRGLCFMMKR